MPRYNSWTALSDGVLFIPCDHNPVSDTNAFEATFLGVNYISKSDASTWAYHLYGAVLLVKKGDVCSVKGISQGFGWKCCFWPLAQR